MRRILKIFIYSMLMISIMLLAACSGREDLNNKTDNPGKITVYTSIYPMYDFTYKIGGDKINIHRLVPSGTEPHDWEPTPKDIARIEKADVFIYNGAGMEGWADKVLNSINNENLVVVEATVGLNLSEKQSKNDKLRNDPHVWLNPMLAKNQMQNIMKALSRADPDNAGYYEDNFKKYSVEFDKLDKEYKDTIQKYKKRDIIVAHQAFGYLCDAYGLNQIAIEGLGAESEPSPARMAEISEFAKKNDVKVIFFEELINPKVAETIANEAGAETMVLNPLEGLKDEDIQAGKEYFSVMRDNLIALEKALK